MIRVVFPYAPQLFLSTTGFDQPHPCRTSAKSSHSIVSSIVNGACHWLRDQTHACCASTSRLRVGVDSAGETIKHSLQTLFLLCKRFDTSAQRKITCQGCVLVLHIGGETTRSVTSHVLAKPQSVRHQMYAKRCNIESRADACWTMARGVV
jgi:hypothetical protein